MNEKKYKISIVIPAHNVNIEFFEKCIESVVNQTIGIDNMQIIVVLHNCDEQHKKEEHELLNKYNTIEVYDLDNDSTTPSSPRNYGLKLAKGEYICFLDSDDRYIYNALEEAIKHNEKYDADMIVFRREYELQNEKLIPKPDMVLWNQLKDEIIINKEDLNTEKIFVGLFCMVTSRVYKKKFFDDNNLEFDEEIQFAEDYMFTILSYSLAKKVLLLPQLIGYHYYINGESLLQKRDKEGDIVVQYAKGYKKIFDYGLETGFYMNYVITRLCHVLTSFMIDNKNLTYQHRVKIKEILEPYISLMTLMKPDKINSEKDCNEKYNFVKEVILNPEKWLDVKNEDVLIKRDREKNGNEVDVLNNVLQEILDKNANTEFGREYGFRDIITINGFQNRVPFTDYKYYKPLIDLNTKCGEKNIFINNELYAYIYTPGNTGDNKILPCTKQYIKDFVKEFRKIVDGHNTFLFMESSFIKDKYNDNTITNSLYGMIIYEYFINVDLMFDEQKAKFTSPKELMFPDKATDIVFERLFFALIDKNVDQICAPYIWDVNIAINYLKKNWKLLCESIENGKLPNTTKISDKLREKLLDIIKPMPERANELRKIFEKGFDENILKSIWPKLEKIIATSTHTMRIYAKELMKYANGVKIVDGMYISAEGMIGEPTNEIGIFKLYKNACFFEFRDLIDNSVKTVYNVEEGKPYELIITNKTGLYRYKTDDNIHILKKDKDDIYFMYAFNSKNAINVIANEYITNTMIYDIICEVEKKEGIEVGDYVFGKNDDKLIIALEPANEKNNIEKILNMGINKLKNDVEKCLLNYNAYMIGKEKNIIKDVDIIIIEPETQLLYRDMKRKNKYYASDQIRPVRLLNTNKKYDFFTNFEIK